MIPASIRLREALWMGQRLALARARQLLPELTQKVEQEYPQVFDWIEWPYVNLSGYHRFIPSLKARGIFDLPGDLLEIGAFVGVGTAKLAAEAFKRGKRVYSVDSFEPATDTGRGPNWGSISPFTSSLLRHHSQWEVYERNTRPYASNIVTLRGDSLAVSFPHGVRLCFAFVDGNHDPDHVRGDFDLAWSRTVDGGVVGFDDYGQDLLAVTETLNRIIRDNQNEITELWTIEPKAIFMRKGQTTLPSLPDALAVET